MVEGLTVIDDKDQRFQAAQEWARNRKKKPEPGSPCERCKREACPPICYPRRDFFKKRRGEEGGEGG